MSQTDFFNKIDLLIKEKIPFVYYRKPQQKEVKAVIQKDNSLHLDSGFSEKGFVFYPFGDDEHKIIFPFEQCTISQLSYSPKKNRDQFIKENFDVTEDKNKINHIRLVEKGLEVIKQGQMSKVVLSRAEEVVFPEKRISQIFKELLDIYPAAFVYVWFHPDAGLWLGATPETLLKIRKGVFKTMALAGTRSFTGSSDIDWNKKEKQEQQFVTDFILSKLDNDGLKVSKSYTLKAGRLMHICTDISGKITDKNNIGDLVDSLHPTPAVCGIPKDKAFDFILKNENYKRSYYTGFLGEIKEKNTGLYVNLRCMQIDTATLLKATLYIGGGITADSIPVKEWKETVEKSKILKSVLF